MNQRKNISGWDLFTRQFRLCYPTIQSDFVLASFKTFGQPPASFFVCFRLSCIKLWVRWFGVLWLAIQYFPANNSAPNQGDVISSGKIMLIGSTPWLIIFSIYRSLSGGLQCFTEGTDFTKSADSCICLPDYYGPDCGIPDAVWHGHYSNRKKEVGNLKARKVQRRIVHGVPVNHEFDFFEARLRTIGDVVDAFIVQVIVVVFFWLN